MGFLGNSIIRAAKTMDGGWCENFILFDFYFHSTTLDSMGLMRLPNWTVDEIKVSNTVPT